MILKKKLEKVINQRKTLLGVGPMSANVVDASIEIANYHNLPLMMIASRRQIDSLEFGGGYVNNWDTSSFSNYIKKKDKKKNIILCRDHGGPWQNNLEITKKYNLRQAMKSAKESYLTDIKNDFKIIHIDASINLQSNNKIHDALERTYELYEFCYAQAKKLKKDILIEVGTEEQTGTTNTFEEIEFFLSKLVSFCKLKKLPKLFFIVLQSGTKVMEMKNIGIFESMVRIKNEIPVEIQIFKLLEICKKFGVYFKEHNTDYLTKIEEIVHPLVKLDRQDFIKKNNSKTLVFDIPLLFEINSQEDFDAVACASTTFDLQKERVLSRPGMTKTIFKTILLKQISSEEKCNRSDYIIDTADIQKAEACVETILKDIERKLKNA